MEKAARDCRADRRCSNSLAASTRFDVDVVSEGTLLFGMWCVDNGGKLLVS